MTTLLPVLAGLLAGFLVAQISLRSWLLWWDGHQWRAARARLVRGEVRAPGLGSWPVAAAQRIGNIYIVVAEPLVWVEEQQLSRARRSLVLADLFRTRRVDLTQIAAVAAAALSIYVVIRVGEADAALNALRADMAVVRDVLSKPLVIAR